MTTVADIVEFRRDLFFDGAVQIGWFENDLVRRDKAASNFVFHGPQYHGVAKEDVIESRGYHFTDTVSFTRRIINALESATGKESPISLAIAGYGTGKSHLGLTLATLLSEPQSEVAREIFANMKHADPAIGSSIELQVDALHAPILVIAINGMGNFDLAGELSRQALARLKSYGLDTAPIDDLWPRFQQASSFVERNFDLRQDEFIERFGADVQEEEVLHRLASRDDLAFQWVNEIFELANGYPIRAVGQESPQQLIQTLCQHYCGREKPFHSMLILFDEFGRYLEFAAERPHIAGDAALQQIFEGVQDNSDKCSLLCLNQYELKVYLSRISRDRQSMIQRYITRYDSARKFYLSSNLETLFAHLIEKKDPQFLSEYLSSSKSVRVHLQAFEFIQKWFHGAEQQSVWRDPSLFQQIIVQGCWPLHSLATWFLCRSSDFLQQRSAITFVADAFEREKNRPLAADGQPWSISATSLCDSPLVKELVASEEYGHRGAVAQAYDTVTQKYHHDLSHAERHTLLAVLIASKLGLKVGDQQEARQAISALSGLPLQDIEQAVTELTGEYGVLEWNERFLRYEIIGDAVPRSAFLAFLDNKTQDISIEKIEEIFAAHLKAWAELDDIDPDFAAIKTISTSEWRFLTSCTHIGRVQQTINNAIHDWRSATKPDDFRGQIIYCYARSDEQLGETLNKVQKILNRAVLEVACGERIPLFIALLHDEEGKLKQILAEYSILSGPLSTEEKQKFAHFVEDHKSRILEELKIICEGLIKKREYIVPRGFQIEKKRLKKVAFDLFAQTYPKIISFPFDGFSTVRGNAVRDCRLITAELLKGTLNHEWIATQTMQTQNRAKTLLRHWGVVGEDGEIRLHPTHQGLREIIISLDGELKTAKVINLRHVFDKLIAPPCGFNIASAGLILGIFLASRREIAVFVLHDQDIARVSWIKQAFSGNFLNVNILNATTVRYISDSEAGEWEDLLSKWDLEQIHIARVSFWKEAQQLRERVPLPAGVLFERYTRLEEQTNESIKAIESLDNFLEKEAQYFERAFQRQNVGNLSRIGKDLLQRLDKMQVEEEKWLDEQCTFVKKLCEQAKQAVLHFFDIWLEQQSCLAAAQVGAFRHRMIDLIGGNLKAIDLPVLAEKLEKHVIKIITRIEERQKISYIIDETQAYLDSHRVHSQCRIAELREWIRGALKLIAPLTEAGNRVDAPETGRMLNNISVFQEACKKQIKQHEERFSELFDLSFSCLEDVRGAQSDVGAIVAIFSGDKPQNIEELAAMQDQLLQFERDILSLSDMSISNEALKTAVANKICDYEEAQNDDGDLPPWEINETYQNILNNLLEARESAASQWISEVSIPFEEIEEMTANDCQSLFIRIESTPAYLGKEQIDLIDKMRGRLQNRLDDLKLEGVLVMFRNLPHPLQTKFLEIVTSK